MGKGPPVHADDQPRRVWFLSSGQRREGILLEADEFGVVVKEDGGGRMLWSAGENTEGELWGFLEQD